MHLASLVRVAVGGILVLAFGAYALSFRYWQDRIGAPSMGISIASGARDVAPGTPIGLTTAGWNTTVTSVALSRAELDERGNWARSAAIPVRLALQPVGDRPGDAIGRVLGVDGRELVIPDARYTLVVHGVTKQVVFPMPWPRDVPVQRVSDFTTAFSPRPTMPTRPVNLEYGQQVELKWNAPMRDMQAVATPAAPVKVNIDPNRPNVGRLIFPDFREGQEYLVTIQSGTAANGVALQRPYSMRVVAPVYPHPEVPTEPVLLPPWQQRVSIHWNTPLASVEGAIGPNVKSRWTLDEKNPSVVHLDLLEYAQGRTYYATVTRARARNGAPLQEAATFEIRTPAAVTVVGSGPENGSLQPVQTAPSIWFSEPVADYAAAEAAISIDPPTPGHFEWPDPRTVQFVPEGGGFPHDTPIAMTLKGGAGTVMAAGGGYLEGSYQVAFVTPTNKRIDVDISEQKLRLFEGEEMVREFVVATGVTGADTPIGEFEVQYKMESARFQGTNPSGRRYDLPNVKWVLAFQGDYTIHGSYWRTVYGRPASNGCVSMTEANALEVFQWSPEGTPISIHE